MSMTRKKQTTIENPLAEAGDLIAQQRLDEAAVLLKQIHDQNPDDPDTLFVFAALAEARDNMRGAVTLYERIIELAPDYADAYTKAATIYAQAGREDWAQMYFEKALEIDPAQMQAYANLAVLFTKRGEYWDAEKISRDGLDIDSRYAPLLGVLGYALHRLDRSEDAIDYLKSAIKNSEGKSRAEHHLNLAVIYAQLSKLSEAKRAYKKSIELCSDYVDAHYGFSQVNKYKKGDPHIAEMEALLEKLDKDDVKASDLHNALAKAYNDFGDYDLAFTHYAHSNFIARSKYDYTTEMARDFFNTLKRVFPKGFEAHALKKRKSDIVPVFIVGMPRSGTTLTEQILSSHDDVGSSGETLYLENAIKANGFGAMLQNPDGAAGLSDDQLKSMRDAFLAEITRHVPEYGYITDKMPLNFRYIGMIRLLFPQAKIVHVRRDPMDCCFSIFKHMFMGFFPFAYDLRELGHYYKLYENLMTYWRDTLPGFIYDVQYEDLVADQEKVTRELLDFCGLEWDPACLEFYKNDRTVLTASAQQVKKPIYKSGVGSWKKYEKHLTLLKKELLAD